ARHITVCYWKVKKDGFSAEDGYPTWYSKIITSRGHQGYIYSTPCFEFPDLIKVCYHDGPDVDPESRDKVDVTWTVDAAAEFVKQHLKGVESKPSIVQSCIYTMFHRKGHRTPDRTCILDKHPRFKNIILGVGFSGAGFKLSPVYGKILCELAFDLKHSYDIRPFRLDRFENLPKSSL
ncbi:peroxisomal sarcosine oxidase, partial [Paramuricea clavata]